MRRPPSITLGLLAVLALGCVDLTRPPRLSQPGLLPDGATSMSDGSAVVVPMSDTAPGIVDAAVVGDLPDPSDVLVTDATNDTPEVNRADGGPDLAPPAPDAPPDVPAVPPKDAAASDKPDATGAANGTACSTGGTCLSGACVDGVCCENACNTACRRCNLSGQAGMCLPIAAGVDPDNECAAAPPDTCGLDGFCNGFGACRQHVAGTTCAAGSCNGTTAVSTASCDGAGHCGTASIHECAPYLCGSGICQTSCATSTDCKAGYVCTGNACVPPTVDAGAADSAPPSGSILLIDDFSDATLTRNTMGGAVTWDNQNVSLASGGVQFSWNGRDSYNDFIETFLQSFCAYDIRAFRTLRFRMSASAGPRTVRIFLPRSNSTCSTAATPLGGTVTVNPTMTTFDVDISATVRDKALFIEFAPVTLDGTTYLLDDVQLIQ